MTPPPPPAVARRNSPLPCAGAADLRTGWTACDAPPKHADASDLRFAPAVADLLARAHGTEPWLARLLIRPLLADLLATGTWTTRNGLYRLVDSPPDTPACHTLDVHDRVVYAYAAGHPAAACRLTAPPPAGRPWFADQRWAPPRDADRSAWRRLLRTSAAAPVLLHPGVLDAHARQQTGLPPAPDTLAGRYAEASAAAAACLGLLGRPGPGVWEVREGPHLWHITTHGPKPQAITLHTVPALRSPQVRRLSA